MHHNTGLSLYGWSWIRSILVSNVYLQQQGGCPVGSVHRQTNQRGWGPLGTAGGGPLPRPRPRLARRTGELDTDGDVILQRDGNAVR